MPNRLRRHRSLPRSLRQLERRPAPHITRAQRQFLHLAKCRHCSRRIRSLHSLDRHRPEKIRSPRSRHISRRSSGDLFPERQTRKTRPLSSHYRYLGKRTPGRTAKSISRQKKGAVNCASQKPKTAGLSAVDGDPFETDMGSRYDGGQNKTRSRHEFEYLGDQKRNQSRDSSGSASETPSDVTGKAIYRREQHRTDQSCSHPTAPICANTGCKPNHVRRWP